MNANTIVAVAVIAALVVAYAAAYYASWAHDVETTKLERRRTIRVRKTLERLDDYGYHLEPAPDRIPDWMQDAA